MNDPNGSLNLNDFSEFYYEEFNDTDLHNITFDLDEKTIVCSSINVAADINVFFCIFYVLIFLTAIPGNMIVGWVISSNRQSLSASDVYLFNLMCADTLLALILPFSAVSVIHGWVFGDAMCKIVCLVKEVNFYTSILFLVCISVDRYMVIVRAMESQKAQRRMCSGVACILVWVLGLVLSLPSFYNEAFYIKQDSNHIVCAERFELDHADEWRLATRIMRHLLGFLVPLVIMLSCYSITIVRLLRTRGFQKQRAMKVIVAVVVAFLLCWTPFHVSTIIDTVLRARVVQFSCFTRTSVDTAMFATQNLGLLHCCVNPVLYAFVGEKFRRRYFFQVMEATSTDYELVTPCTKILESLNSTGLVGIYITVFILSFLGNIVVIFVVLFMENRRTSTDLYLMHLAIADLLFSFTLPFWAAYIHYGYWPFGTIMCKLISGMQQATFYCSVFMLACISIDRYMAIVKATQFMNRKLHVVGVVCALMWLFAILLSLPVMVHREAFTSDGLPYLCHDKMSAESSDDWRMGIRI
ncbi:hypothetical protein DNTS_024879, partial [Danionella cerebrum]